MALCNAAYDTPSICRMYYCVYDICAHKQNTNPSHTAVLSSKGSADITQSDLGDEIPVKNAKETPMVRHNNYCLLASAICIITLITNTQNGESASTSHYNSMEGYRKEVEKDKLVNSSTVHYSGTRLILIVWCVVFRMVTQC